MWIPKEEVPPFPDEYDGLPAYLVGGFVRDYFREDAEPSDVDLMVAGVSREELLDRGFKEIDSPNNETFGVFHDSLGREVAMARTETSTGKGHTDFDVTPIDPETPAGKAVETDLRRRDFTINAMAISREGKLRDPHNGRQDLQDGWIRAVNERSFQHDPLRIVRGARFVAQIPDAIIDTETRNMMNVMADQLPDLPAERVRMELEKALVQAERPRRFFDTLAEVGALEYTFPELAGAFRKNPAGPEQYHTEGTAYEHTMMVLEEMNEMRPNDEIALLMALSHDLGKGATDFENLPSHPAHGEKGIPIIREMGDRLSLSKDQQKAMEDASRYHMQILDINILNESTIMSILDNAQSVPRLIDLAQADTLGREPRGTFSCGRAYQRFADARQAMNEWTGKRLIEDGYDPDEMGGKSFGDLLVQHRVERMRELEGEQ